MTTGALDAATRPEPERRGAPAPRAPAPRGPAADEHPIDPPLLHGLADDATLSDQLLAPLWHAPRAWWLLVAICGALTALFVGTVGYSVIAGPGVWGNNIPAAWAYPIISFVWWIGIGHAGAFLSAALLLSGHRWRAGVHRLAELTAVVALVVAGIFPILHLGRQWIFYWLLPYPSTTGVWPQFKSSLTWDVVTIIVHLVVTALFLFVGLLPDLALARDRSVRPWRRRLYGVLALGWRGSGWQWRVQRQAYAALAALTLVLVVSSESAVSFDFAISQLPGWHSTLFPLYFLILAVYSGVALLVLLLLPVRWALGLESIITARHLDRGALLLLALSLLFAWVVAIESFTFWYSGGELGRAVAERGASGAAYGGWLWGVTALAILAPQAFWVRRLRRSTRVLAISAALVLVAVWIERFVLVIASLNRGFMPSSWALYLPTWVDWSILFGSVGLFGLLLLVLLRVVPAVAVDRVKLLRHELARTPPPPPGQPPEVA